jgi:hypothetical protein
MVTAVRFTRIPTRFRSLGRVVFFVVIVKVVVVDVAAVVGIGGYVSAVGLVG